MPLLLRVTFALAALLTITPIAQAGASVPQPVVEPTIAGGLPAAPGQYGYVVKLETNGDNGFQPFCSGSLIGPRHVLTAAHCLAISDNEDNNRLASTGLRVRFANLTGRPTIKVVRSAYWKDFNPYLMAKRAQADLAILELISDGPTAPVQLSAVTPQIAKRPLMVIGYGQRKSHGPMSEQLMVGQTRIRQSKACSYRGKRVYLRPFTVSEICTSTKLPKLKGSACQGDSGGPLIGGGKLIGVTSWSLEDNCDVKAKYRQTVFARASYGQSWIRQQTGRPLFGLPAGETKIETPPAGQTWIEEADREKVIAKASAPLGEKDRDARAEIGVAAFQMQAYYRQHQTLSGFETASLSKAKIDINPDGQSALISYPGDKGLCQGQLDGSRLNEGVVGVECPGGDWQATIVAQLSIEMKNGDFQEDVLYSRADASDPQVELRIPDYIQKLNFKKMNVFLYARFYNEQDNGISANLDSETVTAQQQALIKK